MLKVKPYKFWFVTGSQHLYGEDALLQVEQNSKSIVEGLNGSADLPYEIVFKGVLTTSDSIEKVMKEANLEENCAGIIAWMHTFSPAKMWIAGLLSLKKPLLHFATQFNRDIPWDTIDMDFMNLNQSAHGDREFGFIAARLRIPHKIIFGHWQNHEVHQQLSSWMKTAVAVAEGHNIRIARFGDNMRSVAVTEGDKVEAQKKFGWSVDYYGIGDLVKVMKEIPDDQVDRLFEEYQSLYDMEPEAYEKGPVQDAIKEQARIELALRAFLEQNQYTAFCTNFEDLHGMKQLPGLAVQRLMADGFGFGAEGDWKTAALLRFVKILTDNQDTTFMEDYTYHLDLNNELILGSHMLEICPTIAATKPKLIVRPLSIGGKEDPARLVFDGKAGKGIVTSLIEMGGRYRLIINEIIAKQSEKETPNLPVAKVLWKPEPSLTKAVEAWIYAGGAHHTVLSLAATKEQLYDFADMMNIECIIIDNQLDLLKFRNELKLSGMIWDK
ncbi:L-arabinose isomerase [Caldibacillus debilis]|uniref:L-arabinose isomerase n=1 Tax=Caldibacillus debilis TaxID=301148 RepID=A0A150LSE6_9BACI|nr:L-arabinose isomerase [Caldibacillus debilis]KYD15173.1 L-arabinose isomerase [Caldibacillus debilis]